MCVYIYIYIYIYYIYIYMYVYKYMKITGLKSKTRSISHNQFCRYCFSNVYKGYHFCFTYLTLSTYRL